MTKYYKDIKKGKKIEINLPGGEYLDKITLGIFPKMGISSNCSPEDCKLVSRIIRNYNWYLQKGWEGTLEKFKVDILTPKEIKFFEEVADFFYNAEAGVEIE